MTVEEMREKIKEKCNYYADCNKCPLDAESSWLTGCYKYATDEEIKEYYKIMVGDDYMSKNYMEQVADILGVEIGEEFKLYNEDSLIGVFKITKDGLCDNNLKKIFKRILTDILTGDYTIEKKWKPKQNEQYFVPELYAKSKNRSFAWDNLESENYCYHNNLICKTSGEAIKLTEIALEAIKKYREG